MKKVWFTVIIPHGSYACAQNTYKEKHRKQLNLFWFCAHIDVAMLHAETTQDHFTFTNKTAQIKCAPEINVIFY